MDCNISNFSIFTPGVSFLDLPLFILGDKFGFPEIFSFGLNVLLSLLNFYLLIRILNKIGVNIFSAFLASFVFLFATNALSYAFTLTQHTAGVTIIFLLILIALSENQNFIKAIVAGILYGFSLLLDIPNVFLILPLMLYISLNFIKLIPNKSSVKVSLKLSVIGILIGILPILGLFAFYNYRTTGSPIKMGQTIGRRGYPDDSVFEKIYGKPTGTSQKFKLPFETRKALEGLYILLISNERSWIYYSPIILIGLYGLFISMSTNKYKNLFVALIGTVSINIVLYSMFGDPWGGWSFGPRYLIPGAAILSIGLGISLQKLSRKKWFMVIFMLLLFYSLRVNIYGAISTTSIPPKVEAIHLDNPIPYTYEYSLQIIEDGQTGSFLYNAWLSKYFSVKTYTLILETIMFMVATTAFVLNSIWLSKNKKNHESSI